MSYILDALKKSEKERNRGKVPDLLTDQALMLPKRKRSRVLLSLVVTALLLNAVMLLAWFQPWKAEDGSSVKEHVGTEPTEPAGSVARKMPLHAPVTSQDSPPPVEIAGKSEDEATEVPAEHDVQEAQETSIEPPSFQKEAIDIENIPVEKKAIADPEQEADELVSHALGESVPAREISEPADEEVGETTALAGRKEMSEMIRPASDSSHHEEEAVSSERSSMEQVAVGRGEEDKYEVSSNRPIRVKVLSEEQANPQTLEERVALRNRKVYRVNELPRSMKKLLPDMNRIAHIYNEDPASRKFIVQGRVVREGDALKDELFLNEITSDGVILTYRGDRYHIKLF
jgi:general secretion pathway protein B